MSKRKSDYFRRQLVAKPHIYTVVFCGDERQDWICPQLMMTLLRLAFDPRILFTFRPIHSVRPIDAARNLAVENYFLPSEAGSLLMLDNDIGPPENLVDLILGMPTDAGVFILPYFAWPDGSPLPMLCFGRWKDGKMQSPLPEELPTAGWFGGQGYCGGTGAMLIRRKTFSHLSAPFFKITNDPKIGQTQTEDINFTSRCAEAGVSVYTNTVGICSHNRTRDLASVSIGMVLQLNRYIESIREKCKAGGVDVGAIFKEIYPERYV